MTSSTAGTCVALVTGSGKQRIGWHVANALADRGYCLAIHYRSSAEEATKTVDDLNNRGTQAIGLQSDIGDETAVSTMIQNILNRFGRLDVLVNCASVYAPKKFEDVVAADVVHNFRANLLGTFLCSQHAGLAMVKQSEGGCIVNFGDWATARPYIDFAAYFASKGAIATLTRSLAVELGTRNQRVRVNCINPGPTLFPPTMTHDEQQAVIRQTVLKRQGSCQSICQAVLFCIDNDDLTGTCLTVDGGRSIHSP